MNYYFAPLEGVTGSEFRRAHHRWFPGVDAYYIPFLSPTQDHVFTSGSCATSSRSTTGGSGRSPSC